MIPKWLFNLKTYFISLPIEATKDIIRGMKSFSHKPRNIFTILIIANTLLVYIVYRTNANDKMIAWLMIINAIILLVFNFWIYADAGYFNEAYSSYFKKKIEKLEEERRNK